MDDALRAVPLRAVVNPFAAKVRKAHNPFRTDGRRLPPPPIDRARRAVASSLAVAGQTLKQWQTVTARQLQPGWTGTNIRYVSCTYVSSSKDSAFLRGRNSEFSYICNLRLRIKPS